jgi:hypothetical protein
MEIRSGSVHAEILSGVETILFRRSQVITHSQTAFPGAGTTISSPLSRVLGEP